MLTPEQIQTVIEDFYAKAVVDPIIGFHFRKIQECESADPMKPTIDAFANHIPRIVNFWRMQLREEYKLETEPFNLIKAHSHLGLKRGQVDRWLILFNETLDSSGFDAEEIQVWKEKAAHFRSKFP